MKCVQYSRVRPGMKGYHAPRTVEAVEQAAAAINSIDVFCNSVYRDALYALQATAYNAEEAAR